MEAKAFKKITSEHENELIIFLCSIFCIEITNLDSQYWHYVSIFTQQAGVKHINTLESALSTV